MIGQCALALGVAHAAKLVHRDVKPANILVRGDGLVKLTDFGIARAADASGHTRAGEVFGTPSYISPEQALGRPTTGASDLYALGVVGHEMLCGTKPFDKPTPIAIAMAHLHDAPPPLPDDVPEALAGVIEDMLAKDPADRPPNARAVAIRLGLADHEIMGLALGLAQAVYGESALEQDPTPKANPMSQESATTLAVDPAALLDDGGRRPRRIRTYAPASGGRCAHPLSLRGLWGGDDHTRRSSAGRNSERRVACSARQSARAEEVTQAIAPAIGSVHRLETDAQGRASAPIPLAGDSREVAAIVDVLATLSDEGALVCRTAYRPR